MSMFVCLFVCMTVGQFVNISAKLHVQSSLSASEVMTLWRYTNLFIIIIILLYFLCMLSLSLNVYVFKCFV